MEVRVDADAFSYLRDGQIVQHKLKQNNMISVSSIPVIVVKEIKERFVQVFKATNLECFFVLTISSSWKILCVGAFRDVVGVGLHDGFSS